MLADYMYEEWRKARVGAFYRPSPPARWKEMPAQLSETLFYVAGGLLDKIWKAARRKEGEEGDCARRRHRKH
ncbi:Hypothetical protein NocV09_00801730 [Nannochloropsis oceanica]